ncbi:MAG: PRC-barrel domain-containing protein [Phycisphaerales bacterium]
MQRKAKLLLVTPLMTALAGASVMSAVGGAAYGSFNTLSQVQPREKEAKETTQPQRDRERELRDQDRRKYDENERQTNDQRIINYITHEKILDADVRNKADEEIGEVESLLINVRDGSAKYLIVSHGETLGVGGKLFAAPYRAATWSSSFKGFEVNLTPEQVKNLPEFDKDDWESIESKDWRDKAAEWFGYGDEDDVDDLDRDDTDEDREYLDKYSRAFEDGEVETVRGEIVGVERERVQGLEHPYVIVTLKTEGAQSERVVIGPSWYVMSQTHTPTRGRELEAQAVKASDDGQVIWVASTVEYEGAKLKLRNDNGEPEWVARRADDNEKVEPGDDRNPLPGKVRRNDQHLAFAEDLDNMKVIAHGEEVGEIEDIYINAQTGHIGFVSIVSGGALGMGETKYLAPYEALAFGTNETWYVDMGSSEFKTAPTISGDDDVVRLNDQSFRDRIYSFYGVEPRQDRSVRDRDGAIRRDIDRFGGWAWGSDYNRLYEKGEPITVEGEVKQIRREPPMAQMAPGVIVVVVPANQDGDDRQQARSYDAHFGPTWYMERQPVNLKEASPIVIQGVVVRTEDGREFVIVESARVGEQNVTFRNADGRPVWDADENRDRAEDLERFRDREDRRNNRDRP